MLGSAILWRVAGLADGLRPQELPNVRRSLGLLMHDLSPVIPRQQLDRLNHGWEEFVNARNSFTHVNAQDGSGFADFANRMRSASEVREYVRAATYFMCNEIATRLANSDGLLGRDGMLVDCLAQFEWLLW